MEIRSYRSVFDLERRVYSVDRLRLNPAGVPVRAVVYFLALLVFVLICVQLPGLALLAATLPWYLCYLVLPGLAAAVLGSLRVEGRPFHQAARALIRHRSSARRLSGIQRCSSVGRTWHPPDLLMLPDGSDATTRALRYRGPGAALISIEHERGGRALEAGRRGWARRGIGAQLHIRARDNAAPLARAAVVSLAPGATLRVFRGC